MTRMADRTTFDRILVDPAPADLDAALVEALPAANDNHKTKIIKWPPADLAAFRQQLASASDGIHGWHGGVKKSYYSGKSQIIVAWWTNMLGNKHVRVMGGHGIELCDRLHIEDNGRRAGLLSYAEMLYADRVGRAFRVGEPPALVGLCDCGAIGSFAALGWVGPCCGPCHDQRLEGNPDPVPLSYPTGRNYGPSLTFDPTGRTLLFARDGLWRYHRATGAVEPVPYPKEFGRCWDATFTPDGKRLVMIVHAGEHGDNKGVAVWDIGAATVAHWALVPNAIPTYALSPDRETIAVAFLSDRAKQNKLKVHATRDGTVLCAFRIRAIKELCFSPDGKYLAATDFYLGPRVWDVRSGKVAHELPKMELNLPLFAPDGRTLYGFSPSVPENGSVFDTGDLRVRIFNSPGDGPSCATFAPGGRILVTGWSGSLMFWDLDSGEVPDRFELSTVFGSFETFAWSPDGRWLATTGRYGVIRLWPWPGVLEAVRARG